MQQKWEDTVKGHGMIWGIHWKSRETSGSQVIECVSAHSERTSLGQILAALQFEKVIGTIELIF